MIDSNASSHRSTDNLVERLRSQFETYGDSRTFTFLHESGRTLVEEVAAFHDLDPGAREVAGWLHTHTAASPTRDDVLCTASTVGLGRPFGYIVLEEINAWIS